MCVCVCVCVLEKRVEEDGVVEDGVCVCACKTPVLARSCVTECSFVLVGRLRVCLCVCVCVCV